LLEASSSDHLFGVDEAHVSTQYDLSGRNNRVIGEVRRLPPCEEKVLQARLFRLKWNYSKSKRAPRSGDKCVWHECEGTRYATGWVSLDFGMLYMCLSDLKEELDRNGQYEIIGLDE
jgi:hypothetical protein